MKADEMLGAALAIVMFGLVLLLDLAMALVPIMLALWVLHTVGCLGS